MKDLLVIIKQNELYYERFEDSYLVNIEIIDSDDMLKLEFKVTDNKLRMTSFEVGMFEDNNIYHGLHFLSEINKRLTDGRLELTTDKDGMFLQYVSSHDTKSFALLKVELLEIIEQHLQNTESIMMAWSDYLEREKVSYFFGGKQNKKG